MILTLNKEEMIMYKNMVLNKIDEFLNKEGFNLIKKGDKTAQKLNYIKEHNEIIFTIEFLSNIYDNNHFLGFSFTDRIPLIENIVTNILYMNKIINVTPEDISYTIHFKNDDKYSLPTEGILINSEEAVIKEFDLFHNFYYKYFLPFFQKWKDLNALYEYIKDKTEREELSEILGQFWQFKKAAILRLCNDSSYQDFMTKFVNRREEILKMRPESIDVQRYYNASKELKQVLDNTKPIYNV